ncbi:hypothetical protein BJ742DRAFT_833584 [Cladochytrium replicatum]|nr:hypothetical protein BJ742DRAFT_833584 [Cladochytrium replicatum]
MVSSLSLPARHCYTSPICESTPWPLSTSPTTAISSQECQSQLRESMSRDLDRYCSLMCSNKPSTRSNSIRRSSSVLQSPSRTNSTQRSSSVYETTSRENSTHRSFCVGEHTHADPERCSRIFLGESGFACHSWTKRSHSVAGEPNARNSGSELRSISSFASPEPGATYSRRSSRGVVVSEIRHVPSGQMRAEFVVCRTSAIPGPS